MARGGTQIIVCQATPMPITGAINPSAESQSAGMPNGGGDANQGLPRNEHLVQAPPRAVPAEPSAPVSRWHSRHHEPWGLALQITSQTEGTAAKEWDTTWAAQKKQFRMAQDFFWDV